MNGNKDIKCCACGCNIADETKSVFVQILIDVPWKFPSWGNFLTGISQQGAAFICIPCSKKNTSLEAIKYIVEFEKQKTNYHEITWIDGKAELVTNSEMPY